MKRPNKNDYRPMYVCVDDYIDDLEKYCTYLENSNKKLRISGVVKSLPTKEEIDKKVDDYAFIVPYDGSNNFHDEQALRHFKAGVDWLKKEIEK